MVIIVFTVIALILAFAPKWAQTIIGYLSIVVILMWGAFSVGREVGRGESSGIVYFFDNKNKH